MENNAEHLSNTPRPAKTTLLGLDVHAKQITLARSDGSAPKPAQRCTESEVLALVERNIAGGEKVYTCYEAGCFGYVLHRKLSALGATNYVVVPQNWDERHERMKNDKRDARELWQRLHRYCGGDERAFCVVRVPTVKEELRRARVRQRNTLVRERVQMIVRGRAILLYHGIQCAREWWRPLHWHTLAKSLPAAVCELVRPWREMLLELRTRQLALEKEIVRGVDRSKIPVGVGAWSWECLSAELCQWERFKNRRQVASYTGLCPSEHSSGSRRRQGSITKHGNPHVRHSLLEMLWRMVRFQRGWRAFKKHPALLNPEAGSRQRRKAAVAAARLLAIDLWRLATGQTTPERIGLRMPESP